MPPTKGQGGRKPPTTTPKTRTGGGGGDDDKGSVAIGIPQAQEAAQEDEQPVLKRRLDLLRGELRESRLPEAYEFSFDPTSLVGSWFHRLENGDVVWQGVIVGEPRQGVYLCWIERQEPGVTNVQRLIPLEQMVSMDDGYEWRLYDTEEEARSAYAQHLVTTERSTEQ